MLNNASRSSILLNKHLLQSRQQVTDQQQPDTQIINSNGIVSPYKLIIIVCLIVCSIAGLYCANNTHWPHVKALTNYFSYYVLQQDDLGIYDRGDNLDQTYIQLTAFGDMGQHFVNLINFVDNYSVNGFANFHYKYQQNVDIQFYYTNGTVLKQYKTFDQFKQIILTSNLRDLLLGLRVLYFQIDLGENQLIDEFKLVFDYQIYSHSMLKLDMSTKYKPKIFNQQLRTQLILRNMERLLAIILMILYSIQARNLYQDSNLQKQFRKNSLYWCISLIILNFISLISSTFAPMCAMMQLLPVLQNYDSSNNFTYNFNINLRYAVPLVFRIIIPVYIILSGFIMYSLIMYPGEYFDDYLTGFFSYFYNNFQYGIYQIFIQIRSKGNIAYLLYIILYFFMVLVGSNLIPALFSTLIYQKMAQRQLIRFVQKKLEMVVCPICKQQNYNKDSYGFEININSPSSPYLKSGTKLTHHHHPHPHSPKNKQKQKQKIARMFIQQKQGSMISPTLSPIQSIKNKQKKARNLIEQLNNSIDQGLQYKSQAWIKQQLADLQETIGKFKN